MSTGHPLTEEQINYIRKHFADTRNDDIAAALGISHSTVSRIQKVYHLRKSKAHNTEMAVKAGKASYAARGGAALCVTPEIIEKRAESYKKKIREERARVKWGLEQLTKIKVRKQPRAKLSKRSYLKSLGYIIDEANLIAYYTPTTTRAVRMEKKDRSHNYYTFKEYTG